MPTHPAALGQHTPLPPRPRIVSLLPSATELLCAAGGEHLLVGRSHECDFPPSITHLPSLTSQRITATDPAAIDAAVREHLHAGSSLYTVNEQLLADLRPDLILTQNLCDVCSIDLPAVQRLAASLTPRPAIITLNPTTIEDVFDDLLAIAAAANLVPTASDTLTTLRARLFAAQEYANPYLDGPVVGFLEWTDPLFCAGHWTVQIIERAGGRHPLNPTTAPRQAGAAAGVQASQRSAGKSIRIPEDIFAATKPDFLVICPCGLTLDQAAAGAEALSRKPWWNTLPAVQNNRVALVDGSQMFNRPGPRLIDAFEWMSGWLNDRPSLIPPTFPWRSYK